MEDPRRIAHEADSEGQTVVHQFSDSIQECPAGDTSVDGAIVNATAEDEIARQRRRQVFQESDESAKAFDLLKVERDRLTEAWQELRLDLAAERELPGRRRLFSRKKGSKVDEHLQALQPYSLEDVVHAVKDAESQWKNADRWLGGELQDRFHRICAGLDDRRGIFGVLPNQNQYVQVFAGSLRLLVKASVNHIKFVEAFSRALEQVTQMVTQAITINAVMNTAKMRNMVAKLYILVFDLLRSAMIWYSSKSRAKVWYSLSDGLYEHLTTHVEEVREQVRLIDCQARAMGLAENREARLVGESTNTYMRSTHVVVQQIVNLTASTSVHSRTIEAHVAQIRDLQEELQRANDERRRDNEAWERRLNALRSPMEQAHIGESMAKAFMDIFRNPNIRKISLKRSQDDKLILDLSPDGLAQGHYHLEEVLSYSKCLEDFIVGIDGAELTGREAPVYANGTVVRRLQEWSTASCSQILWLMGLAEYCTPSNMAPAAISIISVAVTLDIPLISHICDRPRSWPPGAPHSREEAGLIGLVYNLTRQLLTFLPPEIDSLDLSPDRFNRLDGSMETWQDALELFEELLAAGPPLLLCLVDGLNKLDHGSTASATCQDFLNALTDVVVAPDRVFKVFLTTAGTSRVMKAAIPSDGILVVSENPRTRRRPELMGGGDTPIKMSDRFFGGDPTRDED